MSGLHLPKERGIGTPRQSLPSAITRLAGGLAGPGTPAKATEAHSSSPPLAHFVGPGDVAQSGWYRFQPVGVPLQRLPAGLGLRSRHCGLLAIPRLPAGPPSCGRGEGEPPLPFTCVAHRGLCSASPTVGHQVNGHTGSPFTPSPPHYATPRPLARGWLGALRSPNPSPTSRGGVGGSSSSSIFESRGEREIERGRRLVA